MEPFSIATGAVGVLAAIDQAQKCVRKIRTMRNAHHEIVELAEVVSDLHTTLTQVSSLVDSDADTDKGSEEGHRDSTIVSAEGMRTLEQLGKKAAAKLEKLGELIPESATSNASETQGRLGKRWITEQNWQWTRNRAQAKQLQQELRDIQLNILVNLMVICSSLTLHGKLWRSENLAINVKQQNQVIFKSFPESSTNLQHDLNLGKDAQYTDFEQHENFLDTAQLNWDDGPELKHPLTGVTTDIMTRKLPHYTTGAKKLTDQASDKSERLTRMSASAEHSCQDWCSCRCHKRTRFRTSNPDAGFYGSLFVSSNGTLFGVTACDEKLCRQNVRKVFKLMYRPPKWLSNSQVQLSFLSDPLCGPELNVRLPRMVGWDSPLWKYGVTGNIKAIKAMFDNREASPHDVNPFGGSLLHYATDRCYFDLCRLLIERGAASFLVDDLGGNPTWKAWELLLSGKLTEDQAMFVQKHFDAEEYVESREFTVLHKIVLGLARLDLATMLDISTADIDAVDAEGKSCLLWAALRADSASTRILLEYGADPNVADFRKRPPLHHVQSAECCQLLLQHGADIEARDEGGRTALHWACREVSGNVAVVKFLLAAGIDPNTRDDAGETALINAVFNGFEDRVEALLDGDLDATNNSLDLIDCLGYSICNEQYGVLRSLQNHCRGFGKFAHVLPKDADEPLMASEIDPALVKYFTSEQFHLDHTPADGKDAAERLQSRINDFGEAFGWPSSSLDLDATQVIPSSDIMSEKADVFVDAVEYFPDFGDLRIAVTA